MNNKTTTQNLYKGIFWIRDDLPIEQSKDYCIKIPCDLNGTIDEDIIVICCATLLFGEELILQKIMLKNQF